MTAGHTLKRPSGGTAAVVYVGGMAVIAGLFADEYLNLRTWRTASHRLRSPGGKNVELNLQARFRPPPIGSVEWPAGRVLLECAADDSHLLQPNSSILEIGSGIGTAAIGLALLGSADHRAPSIIATDVCKDSLELLRLNAKANGISIAERVEARDDVSQSTVAPAVSAVCWDVSSTDAIEALEERGIRSTYLTHIIGADVVYSGGAEAADDPNRGGLAHTIAGLMRLNPNLKVKLILVNRFAGGAVSAVSAMAGIDHKSTLIDASLRDFETKCSMHGLSLKKQPIPERIVQRVHEDQSFATRLVWWTAGIWESLVLYEIAHACSSSKQQTQLEKKCARVK